MVRTKAQQLYCESPLSERKDIQDSSPSHLTRIELRPRPYAIPPPPLRIRSTPLGPSTSA